MASIVWIGDDEQRAHRFAGRRINPADLEADSEKLAPFAAAAIDATVDDPFATARRLRRLDQTITIVVICEPDRLDYMREQLTLDPFVGRHTVLVSTEAELEQTFREATDSTRQRRRHQQAVDSAQAALEQESTSTGRPSATHYAEAMWSASPVAAIAMVRGSHEIVSANPAATDLLERNELDLLGKPIDRMLAGSPTDDDSTDPPVVSPEGERLVSRTTNRGDLVHLQLRAVELGPPNDDLVLVFLWDVTDRIHLEARQKASIESERHARQKAERASEIREEVLATVSHDLRNPLQQLSVSAQLLDQLAEQNSEIAEVADNIHQATGYMDQLVEDLLDVARIEGKGLTLDYEAVAIDELLHRATEITAPVADEHGVEIVRDSVSTTLTIVCDPTRLVQMLQNLLDNAIKHSPEGERVRLGAELFDEYVCFAVTDNGPGIASEKREAIFENFWQARRRADDGLGLGLAIVAGIVDAHGGDIAVDSTIGEGTTFVVELPKEPN